MGFENEKLGTLLSDPRISRIAADAIRGRDLSSEPLWEKTLTQLREEQIFAGDIDSGFRRLFQAAESGDWFYSLGSKNACMTSSTCSSANLVWLPSEDPAADGRPFILLVPGGGFVHVWNLTEGWPVAQQFNRYGYHVFILTYRVDDGKGLLERNMQDFAAALRFIRENESHFHVNGDRYITCGFSAGGYLVCLWNTNKGYPAFHLPKPQAVFPIYPVTSLKVTIRYGSADPEEDFRLFGCSAEEAAQSEYDVPEHAECFPPCAIFVAAEDELVNPENSTLLASALEKLQIPCRLEVGPTGGHGFADGSGMCMAGWPERAVRWYETL